MVRNPFRTATRRQQFEAMVLDYERHNSALFHADGRENQSNNIGNAFWRGFHGQAVHWIDRDTPLYVAFAAGRAIGEVHRGADVAPAPAELVDVSESGYWREPNRTLTPGAAIQWLAPGTGGIRVWQAMVGARRVASIRQHAGRASYSVHVDGWIWTRHTPGSVAERLRVKESPVRGFPSLGTAKRAVADIVRLAVCAAAR